MKILYVTTISNTINAFLTPHIQMLVDKGHSVDIACNITQELSPELREIVDITYNIPFDRSPLKRKNIKAYQNLKRVSRDNAYDIVHTHTPVASAISRMVFRKSKSRVVYTAHGFHFYSGAPLINWIIYYPIEWWLSKYTDVLITINKEDYKRAKKSFGSKRVEYIPGVGIDLNMFDYLVKENKLQRVDIGVPNDAKVILSVGELNENKNHEVVIQALGILKNPEIHYVICGEGPLLKKLNKMIFEYSLTDQVHLLGFRHDAKDIYLLADLFVFPSKREGLPVALLEALLAGLLAICSNIRGNLDLSNLNLPIKFAEPLEANTIANEINLFFSDEHDLELFSNPKNGLRKFGLEEVKKQLTKIYLPHLN